MGQIDVKQIEKNRRITADSLMETPWNTQIDDCDADFSLIYDKFPQDKVNILPFHEEEK